ncbi:MAG TPA: molybdopterin cofactor-binding domain-containing protein [Janthinobacterium sp.]|nr:molybdopterin cofactor-binding domain-containing protein [Janthinobacterium sp.]
MSSVLAPSRRHFLQSGAALVVSFSFAGNALALIKTPPAGAIAPGKSLDSAAVDAFLALQPDGGLTVFTGKVDLGTGNLTAIAQMVAEEMEFPLDRISVVQGDTSLTIDQGPTNGSLSIQVAGVQLRQAAATVRAALQQLAAQKFGVPPEQLVFADGQVSAASRPAQRLSYAALLKGQRLELAMDPKAPLKNPQAYRVVGKSMQREDIPAKVSGEFTYMQDFRVPGMVHARVIHPNAYGAQLLSFDDTPARKISGYQKTVRVGNLLAVIASTEWAAIKAARELKVKWSDWSGLPEQAHIYAAVRSLKLQASVKTVDTGHVEQTLAAAGAKSLKATYEWPLQTHGSIGPSCAIGEYRDGKLTLWSSTQAPHMTRDQIAAMMKMEKQDVRLIYVEGAGCYGRNGHEDATAEAAVLAKEVGKPVRLQWMRQDEHGWDPKGPPVVSDLSAALNADGTVAAWRYETWVPYRMAPSTDVPLLAGELTRQSTMVTEANNAGGMEFNTTPVYSFPSVQVVINRTETTPLRPAWLRGPGRLQHTYANESFMDELSVAAGLDPIEFRRKHLSDPRALAVLKAAADKADWQPRPLHSAPAQAGQVATGRGVAYVRYDGNRAYVAAIAEVEVDRTTGVIRVRRFTVAHDCGLVVNPDGVRNQIEGQVVQTVSRTLFEEVNFSRSAVTSVDWSGYRLLAFPEMPAQIDVVLVDRPDQTPMGAGEPTCAVIPSALASAVYDAVGIRLRTVPFTPEKVLAALKLKA